MGAFAAEGSAEIGDDPEQDGLKLYAEQGEEPEERSQTAKAHMQVSEGQHQCGD